VAGLTGAIGAEAGFSVAADAGADFAGIEAVGAGMVEVVLGGADCSATGCTTTGDTAVVAAAAGGSAGSSAAQAKAGTSSAIKQKAGKCGFVIIFKKSPYGMLA